jgi:IPT/TIG domain
MSRQGRYPAEIRERAVRMVLEHRSEYPSGWAAITRVSMKPGAVQEERLIRARRVRWAGLGSILGVVATVLTGLMATSQGMAAGPSVSRVCGVAARGYASCLAMKVNNPLGATLLTASPSGYGPSDLISAYNLPSAQGGVGETVGIVDAYDDPQAEANLGAYRAHYGLPPCTTANGCFQKVNQTGGTTYPVADPGWAVEISLDLDMVSAICPQCHILLVEANNNSMDALAASVAEAAILGANAISNSWGGLDGSYDTGYDQYFDHPGIAITAATGDFGYGLLYPAASPDVTAVSGTSLVRAANSRGWSETVWNNLYGSTGSGCSQFEPQPAWQTANSNISAVCGMRATGDVAAVGDPLTGVSVYDTYSASGWGVYGGTSAASPIIASAYALAANPGATSPGYLYSHASSFNDVTSGTNANWQSSGLYCGGDALCTAGVGWDGPSGLGTPNGISGLGGGPPVISTLAPSAGPTTGGQAVTVSGSGFDTGMTASIDGIGVTVSGLMANSFSFTTPPDSAGPETVQVVTWQGISASTRADAYTYTLPLVPPAVSAVTPASGPTSGGQSVTVTGTGFGAGMTATLGGVSVSPIGVSSTVFTFTTPVEAAGIAQVVVTTDQGSSAAGSGSAYTYLGPPAISGVSPGAGYVSGGQTVTVTGTGFTAGMTASIGGVAVTPNAITATSFWFSAPAEPAGTVPIQVSNWLGSSALSGADNYTYVSLGTPVVVSSVTPTAGPVTGGQVVTVMGSGFGTGMTVTIGGVGVGPSGITSNQFSLITPAGTAGAVQIQVSTGTGTSALTAGDVYTYVAAPVVSSVSPSAGLASGAQSVSVIGSGFGPGATVRIGGTLVNASGVTATSFSFLTPAKPAGMEAVQVTTAGGASGLSSADLYTYIAVSGVPVIKAVTPSGGPISGGQTVTATGSGFGAGMTVTIGGTTVSASGVTAGSFVFTTPAKAAGYDQVQVTTIQGASLLTTQAGYVYSALTSYFSLVPFRILDTRASSCMQCTGLALGPGQTRTVQITGLNGLKIGADPVPSTATAVVVNVTAVGASQASLLTVYPNGTGRPEVSNLNFGPGGAVANLVTVALGQSGSGDANREVNVFNALGAVNVVIDVEGYFAPQDPNMAAGEFHSIAPLRVCDTRVGMVANECNQGRTSDNLIGPGQVLRVNVSGVPSGVGGSPASIPSNGSAGAVVLNLSAVQGSSGTYLGVYPTNANGSCSTGLGISNINVLAKINQDNRVMVQLGPATTGGALNSVCVFNALGRINIVLDANGWFGSSAGGTPTGSQYQAIGPTRICDTRVGSGTECAGKALTAPTALVVPVAGVGGIASNGVVAIVANLTAVSGTKATYLVGYPGGIRPNASDLNVEPGETLPNLVVVGLSMGNVQLFNAVGQINALIDVEGWFQ